MTAQERILRNRIRTMLRCWSKVSTMAWYTPVGDHEPYLEISKVLTREMDRAADKARATLKAT